MSDLEAEILAAHDRDDRAALVGLYIRASEQAATVDAACFFLTHAYVFALDIGDPRADALRKRLAAEGREPG